MRTASLALFILAGCATPPDDPVPPQAGTPKTPTRLLIVDSAPRWSYRYLKNALLRDPDVDVHCFLTSADPDFPQEHSPASENPIFRAPLKDLPATLEALLEYDVVILGDVDPADWIGGPGLLRQFVVDHGRGAILISGEIHMPQSWAATEFAPALPVDPDQDPVGLQGEYPCRLTAAGKDSPLTGMAADREQSAEVWKSGLARIQWTRLTSARPAALTLVETGPADRPVPLFVSMESGKGRVFFSGTDETWRWRFRVGDQPWFFPFWKRVIVWAARSRK